MVADSIAIAAMGMVLIGIGLGMLTEFLSDALNDDGWRVALPACVGGMVIYYGGSGMIAAVVAKNLWSYGVTLL